MAATTPDQVHALFEEAFNARDLDRLVALYEPGASLVAQPGTIATGHDQIREALAGFLAVNGPIEMEHLDTVTGTDLAVLHGRWTLTGTGPDGQPLTLGGVTADVVRKGEDGTWRFALDNPFVDTIVGG